MPALRSYLENILANAPIGVVTTDMGCRVNLANTAALRIHGLEGRDYLGSSVLSWMADTAQTEEYLRQVLNEAVSKIEFPYQVANPDGAPSATAVEATVTLLRDDHYTPIGLLLMCCDVTERQLMERRLREAERLSLVGQVAVALQHEINNPLQTVTGNAEMLLQRLDLDERARQQVHAILGDALRIVRLMERMRTLTQVRTVRYVEGIDMLDLEEFAKRDV